MSHYLDPIAATEQPRADFIRYLLTAYPLRDRHLRYGLKQQLDKPGNVWQHPYLEGSQPYRPGNSIINLVSEGVLHPDMGTLFTPSDRHLYEHQEKAIKAVIQESQNIIVSTGTGSGKTECFLVPIVDILLKEAENLSKPGVRALILYPMNALVNDQVKRLRKLLCRQDRLNIRFGFYTSRTAKETKTAIESLEDEFAAYEPQELAELFTEAEKTFQNLSTTDKLIDEAIKKTLKIQAISREEIWENPPHILVTNYSMLEHMLIRPVERTRIFERSTATFKMLIVDEAHTYNGSKGSEVSMLLERLKVAMGIFEKDKIRCIATSASLGNESEKVKAFAGELFGESFHQVITGDRVTATERLGTPYQLPDHISDQDILELLSILKIPDSKASLNEWVKELSDIVPKEQLQLAQSQSQGDIHKFLWFSLKQHPLIHRLINILSLQPERWLNVVDSPELWQLNLPITLDGKIENTNAKKALAHLLQLGTLARENSENLPLLPIRIHLLFRSLEGVYACVDPECKGAVRDPNYPQLPLKYGRLYLNEKNTCDDCASPVLELGSCYQCGQAYVFTQIQGASQPLEPLPRSTSGLKKNTKIYTLTSSILDSITEEDNIGDVEEEEQLEEYEYRTFIIGKRDGWIGTPSEQPFSRHKKTETEFHLAWHRQKDDKDLNGCYLPKCAACGSRPIYALTINRFVAYTEAPLEAMIDSLFALLPEPDYTPGQASKRKQLSFCDGRQDAAFLASDYQRNHTEILYRQLVWQAFQEIKDDENTASVTQVVNQLKQKFLSTTIYHPDRDSKQNYLSYCPEDDESLDNARDCQQSAESRAKELLLREFALPFHRRSTLEAFALLTCHIELRDNRLIDLVADRFKITNTEARIFLTVLTDIIRRAGIVSIEGSSNYFPETGGVDGVRPEMIDVQGKSKNYLFLEKSPDEAKKYQNSPSFLPTWKQSGEISKAFNRLSWYYLQLFGEQHFPNKEDFVWLFGKLKDFKLLDSAKKGYHLHWKRLNIIETQQDWYQCNSCQQIIHVQGLSAISQSTLNISGCPAFKCSGKLQPYSPKRIEQVTNEHYQQYLIKKGEILPLRAQEHTAQLSVSELAKRESRFRQGKINFLSCSTTLEMGVDIGELQAVVLRNFPPHVSNYQQRAGRAGRRTDGVAITLMYGQRRPHDRFYFEQPEQLIAGINQIPKLDSDNFYIQQRHIRVELLAAFLKINFQVGAEAVTISNFFSLPQDFSCTSAHLPAMAIISEFREWLHSDSAKNIAQSWIDRLNSQGNKQEIIDKYLESLMSFEEDQLEDWNELASSLQDIKKDLDALVNDRQTRDRLEKRRNGIEAELNKIAKRKLHDQLIQASILPIYGFPIDVVRLLTGESNEYKSSEGKHRLERDRRLALGEYAPGQDIVVDDKVYHSVGILRPRSLEEKYYWVCAYCNQFIEKSQQNIVEECPVCHQEPKSTAAKNMKLYKVPKGFITDWGTPPKVTPYLKPQRQPTSEVFLANYGENTQEFDHDLGFYNLTISRNGNFFLANQGLLGFGKDFDKQGFAICQSCGRDLTEEVRKQREAQSKKSRGKKPLENSRIVHHHPLTGKDCIGGYQLIHLGHSFSSDLIKIQFERITKPTLLFNIDGAKTSNNQGMLSYRSLTYAILAAAAQVIDIPRTELDGLFIPLTNGYAEIIIYDNVPGGAGYNRRIAESFQHILTKAYDLVQSCSCDTSCYDCLRTYTNQPFHKDLNRHLVAKFLKPLIV